MLAQHRAPVVYLSSLFDIAVCGTTRVEFHMCGAAVESGDTGWVVYYDDVVKDYDPQFTLHALTHRKIQIGGLNYDVSIAKVMGPYHLIRLQTDEAEEIEYWPEPFLIHNGQVL